jgi:SAM-dependent methyltransferase
METGPAAHQSARIPAGSFAFAAELPGAEFRSLDAYMAWREANQSLLEARHAMETAVASGASRAAEVRQPGTCAPCLRPAVFTSRLNPGARTPDGQRVPVWRDEQRCDCEDRLSNTQRGLLHLAQATGVAPWSRVLLFGPADDMALRLASMVTDLTAIPRLAKLGDKVSLPRAADGFHLAVSHDYLQFVPPLASALAAVADSLVPGGRFVFSVNFHPELASTKRMMQDGWDSPAATPVEYRDTAHEFGWDLLAMLRTAGFSDAAACLVWSAELGLLGRENFLFRATR